MERKTKKEREREENLGSGWLNVCVSVCVTFYDALPLEQLDGRSTPHEGVERLDQSPVLFVKVLAGLLQATAFVVRLLALFVLFVERARTSGHIERAGRAVEPGGGASCGE